ncbi:MAG: hypothetical protein ACREMY_22505, partial [bacterium]
QQDEVDQQADPKPAASGAGLAASAIPSRDILIAHVRGLTGERTIECAVLDRQAPGTSKYRSLKPVDLSHLLPKTLQSAVAR